MPHIYEIFNLELVILNTDVLYKFHLLHLQESLRSHNKYDKWISDKILALKNMCNMYNVLSMYSIFYLLWSVGLFSLACSRAYSRLWRALVIQKLYSSLKNTLMTKISHMWLNIRARYSIFKVRANISPPSGPKVLLESRLD